MKSAISFLVVLVMTTVLSGCATIPTIKGDSVPREKNAFFPKENQQIHVVNGGLVHLRTNYISRFAFRMAQPLSTGFMLGRITVSTEDLLSEADLDGKRFYCTSRNAYSDPLTGPLAKACFQVAENDKFSHVKVAPGAIWFTKELTPNVDYIGFEMPIISGTKPLKRELIFEGSEGGNLLFTERLYETSLETPSRAKPLLVKVDSTPAQISLNGAILNVVAYTTNSLTYTLQKAWE